jgi:hypothetical protein
MDLVTDALQQSQGKELALESLLTVQELLDRLHEIEVEPNRAIQTPNQADDFGLGL